MDMLPPKPSLTSDTLFKSLLWLVDRTYRYATAKGLPDFTSEAVINGIHFFMYPKNYPVIIEPVNLHKIKADSGPQFTSA